MVRTCVDTVTKLPRLAHTTCRLSQSLFDDFMKAWRRVDAIFTKLKLRNSKKLTLSQHQVVRELVQY